MKTTATAREDQLAAQIERAPENLRRHVEHLKRRIEGLQDLVDEMRSGGGPNDFSYRDIRDSEHLARESKIMLPKHSHGIEVFDEGDGKDVLHLMTQPADIFGPRRLFVRSTFEALCILPHASNTVSIFANDYRKR
jgi:hypothetical protein